MKATLSNAPREEGKPLLLGGAHSPGSPRTGAVQCHRLPGRTHRPSKSLIQRRGALRGGRCGRGCTATACLPSPPPETRAPTTCSGCCTAAPGLAPGSAPSAPHNTLVEGIRDMPVHSNVAGVQRSLKSTAAHKTVTSACTLIQWHSSLGHSMA